MSTDLKKEFWDRLEDTRVGMLSASNARAVPMSHYIDDDAPEHTLWFITAKDTDLGKTAVTGAEAEYIVSSKDENLYARINGKLSVSNDAAKLDEIWNAVASAWFEDDQRDPDVQLLRLDLNEAEVWVTGGSLKFLFEIAKAHLTDEKPDMGDHGVLRFS